VGGGVSAWLGLAVIPALVLLVLTHTWMAGASRGGSRRALLKAFVLPPLPYVYRTDGVVYRRIAVAAIWLLSLVICVVFIPCWGAIIGQDHCRGRDAALVVSSFSRALWVCEEGEEVARYRVSLGLAGVGKEREGDWRTPSRRESFALGRARDSVSGHYRFIPVEYPDDLDWERARSRGIDRPGSAIGIHPPRFDFLRWTVPWLYRSRGCIVVPDRRTLDAIEVWLDAHRGARIFID